MPTLRERELQQEKDQLAVRARTILDTAEAEKRDLTPLEEEEFDRIHDTEIARVDASIAREKKQADTERSQDRVTDDPTPAGSPGDRGGKSPDERAEEVVRQAFERYLRDGKEGLADFEHEHASDLADVNDGRGRALTAAEQGGYLSPKKFVNDLLQEVDDEVFVRQHATIDQLDDAESLGKPYLETDLADAEWTSEVETGSDDDMKFGNRELSPNPLAKRVKISRKLLRLTSNGAEALVRARLAYRFAVTEEKAFLTGDGNKKPLGIFVASADGIPASRDLDSGTAAAGGGLDDADALIDAKYNLKGQYLRKARWVFHRDILKLVRKLKDLDGQYLWVPGLEGASDRILDLPFDMSEFAPNTIADGAYIAALGDWSTYWIAEALDFEVQRLVELYAEENKVGFIGRQEVDAMPVMGEAWTRVKVGA